MNSAMQKYASIPVQNTVASGTTDGASEVGNDKLRDSSAAFDTDGTVVGDVVWDTADNRMYTVAAIDSATILSLTAIGATLGTGLNTAKTYVIYDISSSSNQLVATDGVVLVESEGDAINSGVDIQYSGVSGIKVRITHAAVAAGNEEMRDGFEDVIESSLILAWPEAKYQWAVPSSYVLDIATA